MTDHNHHQTSTPPSNTQNPTAKILNGSPSPIIPAPNDSRHNLLESIKGFQGFQNKNVTSPPANNNNNSAPNRNSDIQPLDNSSSIVDQLKNELLKRAQFLSELFNLLN
jgi:hypothetical protein